MKDDVLLKIREEKIRNVSIVKGYHLYSRRNEWTNWDGDTNLVRRSYRDFKLTITEAELAAEKARKQGSKFFIDELPAICIKSNNGFALIAELFTDSPLVEYAASPPIFKNVKSLEDIQGALRTFKWSVFSYHEKNSTLTPEDGYFYSRKSSPGPGMNSLAWTLSFRAINKSGINKLVEGLSQLVDRDTLTIE